MLSFEKLNRFPTGQRLVIKNMRENEAGYYQVTYVSGRSPSNVFYELKIGKGAILKDLVRMLVLVVLIARSSLAV